MLAPAECYDFTGNYEPIPGDGEGLPYWLGGTLLVGRGNRFGWSAKAFLTLPARNQGRRPPRIAGPPPGLAIWFVWVLCVEVVRMWPGEINRFSAWIANPRTGDARLSSCWLMEKGHQQKGRMLRSIRPLKFLNLTGSGP